MKTASFIASAALLSTSLSFAGGEGWTHDFEAAKKQAAAENKDLLLDFTGSDWCPPCKDLSARILSQEAFQTEAKKNFILVELDFPNDKSGMDKETIEQNDELQKRYLIEGYPTLILTDSEGLPYANTGHRPGEPAEYLTHLAELRKNKATRDEMFAKGKTAEGIEKAKALFAGLQEVPDTYHSLYPEILAEIKKNDPKDETGIQAAEKLKDAMTGLERDLQLAMEAKNTEQALSLVDQFVAKHEPKGDKKQEVLMIKLNLLYAEKDFVTFEKVLDEIIAVDPDSETGKQMVNFKETGLQQLKDAAKAEKE